MVAPEAADPAADAEAVGVATADEWCETDDVDELFLWPRDDDPPLCS